MINLTCIWCREIFEEDPNLIDPEWAPVCPECRDAEDHCDDPFDTHF